MGESAKWPSGWPFKPDILAGSSPVSPTSTHLELRAAEASALTRVGADSSPARCTNISAWGSGCPPVSGTGLRRFESCRADQKGHAQGQAPRLSSAVIDDMKSGLSGHAARDARLVSVKAGLKSQERLHSRVWRNWRTPPAQTWSSCGFKAHHPHQGGLPCPDSPRSTGSRRLSHSTATTCQWWKCPAARP